MVMRDNSNTSVTHFNVLYVIKCTLHIETRPDQTRNVTIEVNTWCHLHVETCYKCVFISSLQRNMSILLSGRVGLSTIDLGTHGASNTRVVKSASTIGPGRGGTSHLTDFDETWPV